MERPYPLVINGRHHCLLSEVPMVPYEDIVLIAFGHITRLDYVVTWFDPKSKLGGTLMAGESVRLRDGLTFQVVRPRGRHVGTPRPRKPIR